MSILTTPDVRDNAAPRRNFFTFIYPSRATYCPTEKRVVRRNRLVVIFVLCFLIIPIFLIHTSYASLGWTQTYEGDGYDALFPYAVIQTSDGGYALAVFADTKQVEESPSWHLTEQYQLWLIKTDSSGNMQWKQIYGTTTPLASGGRYSLVQTRDGGYAIGGNTAGSEWWLIKTDISGIIQWNKTYTSQNANDYFNLANSMIQTKDGGYLFAGSASSQNSGGSSDFCLLKVDTTGNVQWTKTFDSGTTSNPSGDTYNRDDEAYSLIQTRDGGYVIAGQSMGYNSTDFWLVKTDSSSAEEWNKKYAEQYLVGGLHFLEDIQVVQTNDGGYAFVGSEEKSSDDNDFYLTKVDSAGDFQWRQTYGDKYVDTPCSVVQLADGGFAIGGTITEAGTTGPISRDLAIVRTDSSGNIQWTKTYNAKINATSNTKSEDFAYSLTRTNDGAYVIAGTTENAWDGSHVDVFLVKTEPAEAPPEGSPSASVEEVAGQIEVQAPGQNGWVSATDGASFSAGTKIKTSESSGDLTLSGTTKLQLAPNSLIEIQSSSESSQTLELVQGEVTADVKNLPEGATVEVETSEASAIVKGTTFTVTHGAGETTLSVQEGVVRFVSKTTGDFIDVTTGQSVTATAAGLNGVAEEGGFPLMLTVAVVVVVGAVLGITFWMFKAKKK